MSRDMTRKRHEMMSGRDCNVCGRRINGRYVADRLQTRLGEFVWKSIVVEELDEMMNEDPLGAISRKREERRLSTAAL